MPLRLRVACLLILAVALLATACDQGRLGIRLPVQLEITPTRTSVAHGTTAAFVVLARYHDGALADVTAQVQWSVDDAAVATVSGTGRVTGTAVGSATVEVRHAASGLSAGAELLITPAVLVELQVTPANTAVAAGTTRQFRATGVFSDNTTQDLSDQVLWTSSNPGIASISNGVGTQGLATGLTVGSSTIVAAHPGSSVLGTAALDVTAALLVSLAVTPATPSIALGTTQQFVATGTFSDSSTQDLSEEVWWSSSSTAVATVANSSGNEGLATSIATGAASITATHLATTIAASAALTVTPAVLVSLAVTPSLPSIALGTTQQFAATGTFTDSSTQDLTDQVTWTSSTPATATVSNGSGSEGLATSVATGSTTVTATHVGTAVVGGTTLTVTPAVLVSLVITPDTPWVLTGTTRQFTATGTFSDSSTQDVTAAVTWSSSATGTATISNAGGSQGLATAVAAGAATITAIDPGTSVQDTASFTAIAAITARGTASSGSDTGVLTLTLNTPASREVGDLLVAVVSIRPNTATITPPLGWTLVRRVDNANTADHSLAIYRRNVAAGDPASHAFTFSASTGSAGGIVCLSGVDLTTPVDVHGGQTTASGLSHAAPSVTATQNGVLVFTAHGMSSATDWTPPAGMNEVLDARSSVAVQATGISVCTAIEVQALAGATGARTATASSQADVGNTITIVFRRAP